MKDKKGTSNPPIDAIIPWVNGNDKKWQEKLNQHLEVKINFNKKKESVRFNSIGEVDIAIKSIIKYAPFFKNIYLVTDEQIPDSFKSLKSLGNSFGINLEVIDHKIIFQGYEEFYHASIQHPLYHFCTEYQTFQNIMCFSMMIFLL